MGEGAVTGTTVQGVREDSAVNYKCPEVPSRILRLCTSHPHIIYRIGRRQTISRDMYVFLCLMNYVLKRDLDRRFFFGCHCGEFKFFSSLVALVRLIRID